MTQGDGGVVRDLFCEQPGIVTRGDKAGDGLVSFEGPSTAIVAQMRKGVTLDSAGLAEADDIFDFKAAVINQMTGGRKKPDGRGPVIELAQAPRRKSDSGTFDREAYLRQIDEISRDQQRDKLKGAEEFVRKNGVAPEQAIASAVKCNDVTFIGEMHPDIRDRTIHPHREMIARIMKDLPPGTRVAIELPSVLKPVFDKFNESPKGSDLEIPEKIDGEYGAIALAVLRLMKERTPDLVEGWKAARDAGHKVVPIKNASGVMGPDDPKRQQALAQCDEQMKDTLKRMHADDKNSPIVAWLGSLHCAQRSRLGGHKSAAELLSEDPEFMKSGGKITSFHGQIAQGEDAGLSLLTLNPLTGKFDKPLSVPTMTGDKPNAVGDISLFESPRVNSISGHRLSDFDNVIVYPEGKKLDPTNR